MSDQIWYAGDVYANATLTVEEDHYRLAVWDGENVSDLLLYPNQVLALVQAILTPPMR